MRHGILLFSLLVLFTGATGGVFVLVHQSEKEQEITKETLVASVSAGEKLEEESVSEPKAKQIAPQTEPTSSVTPTSTPAPPPLPPPLEKININTANLEELDQITGVGPAIAQRIIDYRNTNGLFQRIEDIINVDGIGDVTFEKMKDQITI